MMLHWVLTIWVIAEVSLPRLEYLKQSSILFQLQLKMISFQLQLKRILFLLQLKMTFFQVQLTVKVVKHLSHSHILTMVFHCTSRYIAGATMKITGLLSLTLSTFSTYFHFALHLRVSFLEALFPLDYSHAHVIYKNTNLKQLQVTAIL